MMMAAQLNAKGVTVVKGACSESTCATLLDEVLRGLERMLALPQSITASMRPPSHHHIVRVSVSPAEVTEDLVEHRRDFKLPFSHAVDRLIRTLVTGAVGDILSAALGPHAELCELTTITNENGAAAQSMHSDGTWSETLPRIVTVFLALHDVVDECMGPTRFCPMTRDPRCFPDGLWVPPTKARVDQRAQVWFELQAGDAVVMDSTTWHCGGANTSEHRRTLLAASFRSFAASNVRSEGREAASAG